MASTKEYLNFILEQLSELDDISYRAMMGEYILYYRGKVFGGIYDDRFLVKPVELLNILVLIKLIIMVNQLHLLILQDMLHLLK